MFHRTSLDVPMFRSAWYQMCDPAFKDDSWLGHQSSTVISIMVYTHITNKDSISVLLIYNLVPVDPYLYVESNFLF